MASTAKGERPPAPAPRAAPAPIRDLRDPFLYLNRELSWLAFNDRVLAQARTSTHPLLERVKFLAIAANNLDEFFMVRVADLGNRLRDGVTDISPDGRSCEEQLGVVRARASAMLNDLSDCWTKTLRPELATAGIRILEPSDYSAKVGRFLEKYFSVHVCPVLTPLAFDPGHPFPHISNRSKSLAVVVKHRRRTKFARVKVADVLPRFVPIPRALCVEDGESFAMIEDVIRLHLPQLFTGISVTSAHLFRVIRDMEVVLEDRETEDLMETVDRGLKQQRHGALALLEVEPAMPARVLDILVENFEIEPDIVAQAADRMGFADWMALATLNRPDLKDRPHHATTLWRAGNPDIFQEIKYRDYLVHHPYDSFSSVEAFVEAAVEDPHVVAIKMTLYRIGVNSPLVDRLIAAAEQGKQVAVLVELKARFDERSNIEWASRLEDAGVHVVYGLENLKTHCKVCLIVRKEGEGIQRYVHIGTGNYNRATAHVYTDLGLFTANADIVADASELFNYLTGYSNQIDYRQLLVAPVSLRRSFSALVEREMAHAREGRPARVIIKCNALSDARTIRVLYRASQAGVPIDLIIRGICCLRPAVAGVSDTITVRSIVGRFLEHSRMWYFENGGEPEVYIGSADLMERNLSTRVEAVCPVLDPELRRFVRDTLLGAYLADTLRTSVLRSDGEYEAIQGADPGSDAQSHLMTCDTRVESDAEPLDTP